MTHLMVHIDLSDVVALLARCPASRCTTRLAGKSIWTIRWVIVNEGWYNMLAGVERDRYMFRVGKEREAEALAKPGASPMDFTGRPMGGFIYVDAGSCDEAALLEWVNFTAAYIDTLPAKKPKMPKARKAGR